MASRDVSGAGDGPSTGVRGMARRLSTETKAAFKTTEFYAYLVVLVGLLIAGHPIEGESGRPDEFAADKVWLYVTLLTIGYMVSRGWAKSGAHHPDWDTPPRRERERRWATP